MKKLIVALILMLGLSMPKEVKADCLHMVDSGQLYKVKATAYCLKGTMANGEKVRQGVVAYAPELIGMTMVMYDANTMECLGVYDIADTGSSSIRKGYVVDVWIPTYAEAIQYGSKDVLIQIINAKG